MDNIVTIIISFIDTIIFIWIIVSIKYLKNTTKEIENKYDQKIKHLWDKIDEQKKKIHELEEKVNNTPE